jgi:uncharacterized protein YceH (UPF0502 family)
VKSRLDVVEAELGQAQSRYDELVEHMADPAFYSDKSVFDTAIAEFNALKARIPVLEEEWVSLSQRFEQQQAEQ